MPLAPGENVRVRRTEVFETSRRVLTWLASMSALVSMLVIWLLVELSKANAQSEDPQATLIVNSWLNLLAFGMAALSSAAVVGAIVMRTLRDSAEIG